MGQTTRPRTTFVFALTLLIVAVSSLPLQPVVPTHATSGAARIPFAPPQGRAALTEAGLPQAQAQAEVDAASADARQAIAAAQPNDRLRVIVRFKPARTFNPPSIEAVGKRQARAELVSALQADAADAQRGALSYLASPDVAAQVDDLRAFWIINGIALRTTPAVVNALAARPDVESVRLDETVTLDRASTINVASRESILSGARLASISSAQDKLRAQSKDASSPADESETSGSITEKLRAALAGQPPLPTSPELIEGPGGDEIEAGTSISYSRDARIDPLASGPPGPGDATWGVKKIRADQAWKALGITGQGVVVANIDSGVDWSHPALQSRYRGYSGGPAADHMHNWYDATDEGAVYPSDADGHGTHVMGTIVGLDGIGVAPGATWMAVKGLNGDGIGLFSWLHSAFQFILAPGGDPAYAPDVVNNSWGASNGSNVEFREDIAALRAAGILAVFANGNRGPQQGTVASPASLPGVVGVGASDPEDAIAYFSSRGPSPVASDTKPLLSAPGVDVVSAFPGGGFKSQNGTSMAAPHLAGAAALLLSAQPTLNISATLFALTSTAKALSTTVPNRDSGWGRIDAYRAVLSVLPAGAIVGSVRDGAQPLANAIVVARDTAQGREASTVTGADGTFDLRVAAGQYVVEAGAFGYVSATSPPKLVVTGSVESVDLDLAILPSGSVRGTVRDAGTGAYITATVRALGTPKASLSNNSCLPCRYSIDLPSGTYVLEASAAGYKVQRQTVTVSDNALVDADFALSPIQRIAFVDSGAFYYSSAAPLYREAFAALQLGYDEFTIKRPPQDTPTITDLLKYDTVIWSAPYDAPSLVGASDVLSRYLAAGKNLLLTGQDVALFDGGGVFAYPYYFSRLNAVYKGETNEAAWVTGAAGGPIAGKVLTFTSQFKRFHPDVVTLLRPEGGQRIGNYSTTVNGESGAGTWVWQCTRFRSAFYAFGLETLDAADRADVINRTLDAFVAPRPPLGVELVSQDAYFTGAAIGQPGSVVTHVMRLRNSGDGGVTQTITLEAAGNQWQSRLSATTFTLAPCATANVTLTVAIPRSMGWNASDVISITAAVASSPSTRASISFTSKTPAGILLVDDDRFFEREQDYQAALTAQGNAADRWDTRWGVVVTNTPSAAFLQQYPVVVWFNGYDWYEPLSKRDEQSLRAYLNNGGRLFLASQAALQYIGESALASQYLGVAAVDYDDPISTTAGMDGTPLGDDVPDASLLPFPYTWNLSTAVKPVSGTHVFLLNNTGHPAGVLRDGGPGNRWRAALTPFAFEVLPAATRDDLMNRIVGWLSPLGRSDLRASGRSVQPGQRVLFTLSLRADDVIAPTYQADHPASVKVALASGLTLISSTLAGPAAGGGGPGDAWSGVVRDGDWMTWTLMAQASDGLAAGTPLTASARFSLEDAGLHFTRHALVRIGAPAFTASLDATPQAPAWGSVVTLTFRLTNTAPVAAQDTVVTITLPASMTTDLSEGYAAGVMAAAAVQTNTQHVIWRGAVGSNERIEVTFAARLPNLDKRAVPAAFISARIRDGSGMSASTWLWLEPRTRRTHYPVMAR